MSNLIVQIMLNNKIITAKECDAYVYCFNFIIDYIIFLFVSLLIGLLFRLTAPVCFFLISFLLMRTYGGGYHAKTHKLCLIYSYTIVFICCIFLIIASDIWNNVWYYCINTIYILSYVSFIVFYPKNTYNKMLDTAHLKKIKLKNIISNNIIMALYVILLFNNQYIITASIALGSFISALSLWIGRVTHES